MECKKQVKHTPMAMGCKDVEPASSQVRSWIIVLACCWINITVFAMLKSRGVLYLAILQNFDGSTSADASWQITLINSMLAITSLPAGFLSHYYSERSLVLVGIVITSTAITTSAFTSSIIMINILLGFLQGVGLGLVMIQLPVIITQYFDPKSRAAAVGVSFAASTIGGIISPLLFDGLLQSFSLGKSCFIMGIVSFTSILGAISLKPHPEARARKEANKCSNFSAFISRIEEDFEVTKNPFFRLICMSYSAHYLSNITITMLVTDFAMKCGLSHTESVFLLSVYPVGNLLGRLCPLLTKLIGLSKCSDEVTYVISMTCLPLIYASLPALSRIEDSSMPLNIQFMIIVILIGFFGSFQFVLPPVLLAKHLGPSKTAGSFGLVNFVSGLVSFSRPFIITLTAGQNNNYAAIFYTFSTFPLISAFFWILHLLKLKCE